VLRNSTTQRDVTPQSEQHSAIMTLPSGTVR